MSENQLAEILGLIEQLKTKIAVVQQKLRGALVCVDCGSWSGTCRSGKPNRLASSPICDDFKPKGSGYGI